MNWRGDEKRAAGRGIKEWHPGELEKSQKEQCTKYQELTVDLQSPGEKREKKRQKKMGFVVKKQVTRKGVDGGVEICGIFPTPTFLPLSTAVILGVLVHANCIFSTI